ncbi:rhodanese-like domain-containing protein [Patescibacteria group bacterium]|nr:rhodanese-like domain-containing protein [Patescibacteria group bacterium]
MKTVTDKQLHELMNTKQVTVIDVRTPEEFH